MSITLQTTVPNSLIYNLPLIGNALQIRYFNPLLSIINEHIPKLSDRNERDNSLNKINHALDLAVKHTSHISPMILLIESIAIIFFTTCVAGVIPGGIAAFICFGSFLDTMDRWNTTEKLLKNLDDHVSSFFPSSSQDLV